MTVKKAAQNTEPIGDTISPETVQYYSNLLAGKQPKTAPDEIKKEPHKSIAFKVGNIPASEKERRVKTFQEQIEKHSGNWKMISSQIFKADPNKPVKPILKTVWSCKELLDSNIKPPEWLVEDVVQIGKITLIAGKPKSCKSFFGNQVAIAVATGTPMFGPGGKAVKKGRVIKYSLEDPPNREKKRLLGAGVIEDLPIKFIFCRGFKPIDQGGDEELRELIEKEKPSLIIIDTVSKIYSGHFDENRAEHCLSVFPKLRTIADETGVSFLLFHHFKKGAFLTGDPRDDLRGSSAIAGDVDIICGIYRESGKRIFRMMGNDLEEDIEWVMEFDTKVKLGWSIVGKTEDVAISESEKRILELICEIEEADGEEDCGVDAKQLAKMLRKSREAVKKLLDRLVNEGKVYITKRHTGNGSFKNVYHSVRK